MDSFEGRHCNVCISNNLPYCICDHPGIDRVNEDPRCGLCGEPKGGIHATVMCTHTYPDGE